MQATLDQKKPLCIVIDPVRGGAPLHEIEAECAAHLHHLIFGPPQAKRDIITWHRIKDFQLVSIKLLAEQLLIGCLRERSLLGGPDNSMALFVPGELQRQKLVLSRRVVVYASPHNPGALAVAKDIASAMDGQIKVTSDPEVMTVATHFLLYLNDQTYLHAAGIKLAEELRRAREAGSTIEVLMVHENDPERGGCEFSIFFDGRTPPDLKQGGIYDVRVPIAALCSSPSSSIYAYSPGQYLPLISCVMMPHSPDTPRHAGACARALFRAVLAGLGRASCQGDGCDRRSLVLGWQKPSQFHDSLCTAHRRSGRCGRAPYQRLSWGGVRWRHPRRADELCPGFPGTAN